MNSSMTKRPPPSFNRCLLCFGRCSVPTTAELSHTDKRKLSIPGAGDCGKLNKQLEQIFIVRQLLDLPVQWCEQTLKEQQTIQDTKNLMVSDKEGESGDDEKGNDHLWFKVCTKCIKTSVQPAWDLYQKLAALEAKINTIKLNIKETMKEHILRNKRNKRWAGFTGEGVDCEIRKQIFPDLLILLKMKDDEGEDEANKPKPRTRYKRIQAEDIKTESSDPDPVLEENSVLRGDEDMDWEPPHDYDEDDVRTLSPPQKVASQTSKLNAARKKRIWKPRKRKPRPMEELQRFLCPQCGSYLTTQEDLANHLEAHEQSKQTEGGRPFDCTMCSFPGRNQQELQRHVKIRHERVRFYPCPKCDFKGKTFKKMKEHVGKEHPDMTEEEMAGSDINLTCQTCSRKFLRLEHFVLHQKKSHPELFGADSNEPLECQQCGQRFMSKIRLDYHIIRDHTDKPSKYVCDECGKGFQWKCRLESHKVMHVNKVKRDFVCHLCGVDYAYRHILETHYKKTHPGEEDGSTKLNQSSKEFKCRYCELTSPYSVVIKRHLQTHKVGMGHRCGQCGNCYTSDAGLRRHLKVNHPVVKENIPCPHCRKQFPSVDYMRDHVRSWCKVKNEEQNVSGTKQPAPDLDSQSSQAPSNIEITEHEDIKFLNNVFVQSLDG